MSAPTTRSMKSVFMASPVLFLVVLSILATLVSASSSVLAWQVQPAPSHGYDLDSMSDLLLSRVGSESTTFVKAKQLIQDLSSSSTCSHGPTVRLIQQCKNIKPKSENANSDYQISNAESVYAISMALCEARQARIDTPPACRLFEGLLERPLNEPSIEIVRSDEIEACSAVLYNTPSWTSYSTFKSNSRYLCDSSRTDYRQEELLQTLQDVTGVIPEILDALSDHRLEAQLAMLQLRETALNIDTAQQEILLRAQEQGQVHSTQMDQLMRYIQSIQKTMTEAVVENSKILDLSTQKAGTVEIKLTEMYASFAEASSGLTFDFEQQTLHLSHQITSMIDQIHELGTQDRLDQLRVTMDVASQAASEISRLQVTQLATSQQVLQAFNEFSPEHLLPKWFGQFSNTITTLTTTARDESAFFAIFASPAFGFLLFGRHRLASTLILSYAFARSIWSYLPSNLDVLIATFTSRLIQESTGEFVYLCIFAAPSVTFATFGQYKYANCILTTYAFTRSCWAILGDLKHLIIESFLHFNIEATGFLFLGASIPCLVLLLMFLVKHDLQEEAPEDTTEDTTEKHTKRAIKADFERNRRACSVPLDCDYA